MSSPPNRDVERNPSGLRLAPAEVEAEELAGGGRVLRSPRALEPCEPHLGVLLRRWAKRRGGRTFLAERAGDGWRRVSWSEALARAESIGESLLARGLGPERAVTILSGNSVDHALLTLGAHLAGVPVAPVSPAYSLLSRDFEKLRHVVGLVDPAVVFVEEAAPFAPALAAIDLAGRELVTSGEPPAGLASTPFEDLLATRPGAALARAEAALGPGSVAKYLFTSGSTGMPKGVINTHGMLTSNQQMIEQTWLFLRDMRDDPETPLVLLDWLPWNHTFGGNHNFNLVLNQGGTLYVDGGKPAPGLIEQTVRNLRQVSPTIYFNVPAGFSRLLPFLERDDELRRSFFRRLKVIFYAGAALPQDLWERLEKLTLETLGRPVFMTSAWGSTETSPLATTVHFPIERAGVIGLPPPGVEIKMVPAGSKMELRVKGPNVTPGYLGQPELTAATFDDDGFYKIGDAGRLADPDDPSRGLLFDGRVAEDFKLSTGTWVNAGRLRVKALAAASPALQDAVVTGHDRDWVGLLAWLNVPACQKLAGDPEAAAEDLVRSPAVARRVREGLARHNAEHRGSSMRIERVLLMTAPPSIDVNEVTDKGYVNQRATLENRADLLERLYREPAADDIVII